MKVPYCWQFQKDQNLEVLKGQLFSITYSIIVKSMYKLSKTSQQLNEKLQLIGKQIGLRVADQYNNRNVSRLNPAQNVKGFIQGILFQFLGVQVELTQQSIQFLKRQHLYDLQYTIKQIHFADFVLLPQKMFDSIEQREVFNYLSILTGFICGVVETMNFKASVVIEKDSLQQFQQTNKNIDMNALFSKDQTIIRIKMQKQIKNDD